MVMALTEVPFPGLTYFFARGDHEQPKDKVKPGELDVLADKNLVVDAPKDPNLSTTGRRLAYARWLTSGNHPLVARVLESHLASSFWPRHRQYHR
jgi:hypothetical protein